MDEDLSNAVRLYLGYHSAAFPHAYESAVTERYGSDLLIRVESIVRDAGDLQPDWALHSLLSAKEWAEAELKRRHPELDDAAVSALGWAFSYWWK